MSRDFHLLYDGQCGFCARAVRALQRVDIHGVLRPVPSQDRERIARDFPSIDPADLEQAMYVVTASGAIHRGYFAFRRLMSTSPWLWPLLPVFYFPGSSWVGPWIYAWVARNRRKFGCEGDVCALPGGRSSGGGPA
jgi:predicted DCC family thiol-disulfide oxidoreductase YuxK